jgi:hypothetical protein
MKRHSRIALAAAVIPMLGWHFPASADSTEAMCKFRKDGETRQNPSGPCSFSQRQGYVSITLRNGDNYELRPTEKADHFKDEKGNKVVRTVTGDGAHEYKWENKKIIVSWTP